MAFLRDSGGRRKWTTAGAAAVLAAVFLFVPVSYQKTVGHEVTALVSGAMLGDSGASALGDEFRDRLGTEQASVRPMGDGVYELAARVAGGSESDVNARLAGFTTDLAGRGVATTTAVRPIRERVRGNVYLAAANSIITLHTDGRSAAEIESDLRGQLESAGVYGADVQVADEGGCRRICVRAEGAADGDLPEIQCESSEGTCASLQIRRTPDMTDDDLAAEIERQLAAQGIQAEVTVGADGTPNIEFLEGCN